MREWWSNNSFGVFLIVFMVAILVILFAFSWQSQQRRLFERDQCFEIYRTFECPTSIIIRIE